MDFGSVAVAHRSAAVTRHPSPSQGQTGCGFALARRVTGPLSGGPNEENGMDRAQKTEAVHELNCTFNQVGQVVVTSNLGLTAAQSTKLGLKMREAGETNPVPQTQSAKTE